VVGDAILEKDVIEREGDCESGSSWSKQRHWDAETNFGGRHVCVGVDGEVVDHLV
jgi:hypothetical protein